jgi:hypothetical protein
MAKRNEYTTKYVPDTISKIYELYFSHISAFSDLFLPLLSFEFQRRYVRRYL